MPNMKNSGFENRFIKFPANILVALICAKSFKHTFKHNTATIEISLGALWQCWIARGLSFGIAQAKRKLMVAQSLLIAYRISGCINTSAFHGRAKKRRLFYFFLSCSLSSPSPNNVRLFDRTQWHQIPQKYEWTEI